MSIDRALELVTAQRAGELTRELVDIASPTGEELPLAEHIASLLDDMGMVEPSCQILDGHAANAWGALDRSGAGPSLLLYAPLDTVSAGNAAEDIPWVASELRADHLPQSYSENGWVVGLGAHNPKGHAACVLLTVEALAAAGVSFDGRVVAGFGALGMPANRRAEGLLDGHGTGCHALIDRVAPDAAVIAKSGWAVSWSEVGLAWFTVTVTGHHNYVGSRHLMPYRNPIVDAARIIDRLEPWFEQWAVERADDLNSPQGIVASIDGGQDRVTAFTGDSCQFTVDLRLPPGVSGEAAEADFTSKVQAVANELGARVSVERTVTIDGTITDPTEPIIRAAISAWEETAQKAHEPIRGLSGATDANILRGRGVPTARVGLPKVKAPGVDVDFAYGMNAVNPEDQVVLTRQLIRTAAEFLGVSS